MFKRTVHAKLFFLLVPALFFATGARPSFAQSEPVVSKITIEGNKRIPNNAVQSVISQKAGQPYDESKTAEDIRNLYATGNFYDVAIEKEVSGSEVELTYTLKENPVLVEILLKDNKRIKDDDIKKALTVEENRIVGEAKIRSQIEEIAALYAVKGYSNARVSYEIEPESEGGISVAYKIDEGPKATISSVTFEGNENIKTDVLKKRIFSAPRRFYSLGQRGLFVRDEIDNDAERIKFAYLNEGYLDVKVSGPELDHNREKNSYGITFRVEEGRRYFVSDISLEGAEPPPEISQEKILYGLNLKKGEPYGNGKLASDISLLTSIYANEGYANVNVEPSFGKATTDDGKPGVAVVFTIEKGEVFHIGRINISGNDKTVDRVVRRQIQIAEGDTYKASDLGLIKPLVGRLGFFDAASIQVSTEQSEENPNELDVNVVVRESSTAQFNLGAGISSVEDFIFFGSIQEANLFGYGKRLDASVNFGSVTDTYRLRYSDPNFRGTDWNFDIDVSRVERDFTDYDSNSNGTTIGFGRSLYKQLWGSLFYRWEDLEITNPTTAARNAGIVESEGILSAVGANIRWDNRDNYLFPRSGYRTSISYEHSGPFGGDTDLSKLVMESGAWIPLVRGSFLALKVRYDRLFLRGEDNNAHAVNERLFLGGASDLRGFDYRDVRVNNSPRGGTERIYGKADLVIPLFEPLGFFGILFYDIGNVFDSDRGIPFSIDPSDLRKDFGYGFWWRSPLGLIKIEVGYPVDRGPSEERKQVNFSIGASF